MQHVAADQLLDIVDNAGFLLILPKSTITWEARNTYSTINLVFISKYLAKRLDHCKSRPELNQFSDHISILTWFFFFNFIVSNLNFPW